MEDRSLKLLPTAAALLLALPLPAAQEPALDQPFAESIDVEVVNVEVIVTDREGRHVRGLARDGFELFVDGRPVEIVNFSEIAHDPPVPADAGSAEAAPAASSGIGSESALADAAPPEPQPLSIMVFVDNDNLRPFGRNRVLRQLQGFLDSIAGPRDRVMLATHNQGVTIRRPLVAGKVSLAADLKGLEKLAAGGVQQDSHTRRTMEMIRDLGCDRADEADQVARGYAREVANGARLTLNVLESMVESFSGLEGRKAILYVSDGLPLHPGEEMFRMLSEMCGGQDPLLKAEDLAARFRQLTRLANANGVTFYTLEATGVRNFSAASAADEPLPLSPLAAVNLELSKSGDTQQVLFNLASETGGRAVLNGNDIRTDLARIAGDLQSYYSLGYTPERSGDGRVHAIEVKVKREGLKVRSRTSYTDRPREQRLAARVQTALLHGIVDNPLQARLEVVSARPAERGKQLVTLRLWLPLKQLVLVSQGGSWTGQLTLWLGARDGAGRIAPVQSVRVPIRISAAEGKPQLDRPFVYDIQMRMAERGEQTVALGIRDDLGQTSSFLRETFRVDRKGTTSLSGGQ